MQENDQQIAKASENLSIKYHKYGIVEPDFIIYFCPVILSSVFISNKS
jgi:hypothetical protein